MLTPLPPSLAGPPGSGPGAARRAFLSLVLACGCGCGGSDGGRSSAAGPCDPGACALREAIVVRVTPQGEAAPVPGAFVAVRGERGTAPLGTVACAPEGAASVCRVEAGPGLYDLSIGAPGYETAIARAEVTAAGDDACCPTVNPVAVEVPLARTAP